MLCCLTNLDLLAHLSRDFITVYYVPLKSLDSTGYVTLIAFVIIIIIIIIVWVVTQTASFHLRFKCIYRSHIKYFSIFIAYLQLDMFKSFLQYFMFCQPFFVMIAQVGYSAGVLLSNS